MSIRKPLTRADLAYYRDTFDRVERRYGRDVALENLIEQVRPRDRGESRPKQPRIDGLDPWIVSVIEAVAASWGRTVEQLKAGRRYAGVRDEAVYVVRRTLPRVSFPALGRFFERDHSTLIQQQRVFERRLATDDILRQRVGQAIGDNLGGERKAVAA